MILSTACNAASTITTSSPLAGALSPCSSVIGLSAKIWSNIELGSGSSLSKADSYAVFTLLTASSLMFCISSELIPNSLK